MLQHAINPHFTECKCGAGKHECHPTSCCLDSCSPKLLPCLKAVLCGCWGAVWCKPMETHVIFLYAHGENSVHVMTSSVARCLFFRINKLFSLCPSPASSGAGSTGIPGAVPQPCYSAALHSGGEGAEKTLTSEAWEGSTAPAQHAIPMQTWSPQKGELFLTEVVVSRKLLHRFLPYFLAPGKLLLLAEAVLVVRITGEVLDLPLHKSLGGCRNARGRSCLGVLPHVHPGTCG